MKKLILAMTLMMGLLICAPAHASKGEMEIGGGLLFDFSHYARMYGGGVDLFARYEVIDSLQVALSLYLTGNYTRHHKHSFGLFHLRAGALYNFDVVAWVPYVGAYITTLFSDHDDYRWHAKDFGLGVDLELGVAYKGIRPLGIGLSLTYHIFFTKMRAMPDFFTLSLWFSYSLGKI
ncbi:MAG: outer membrane beta-barrel protein [Bradymonadales bacterium]